MQIIAVTSVLVKCHFDSYRLLRAYIGLQQQRPVWKRAIRLTSLIPVRIPDLHRFGNIIDSRPPRPR